MCVTMRIPKKLKNGGKGIRKRKRASRQMPDTTTAKKARPECGGTIGGRKRGKMRVEVILSKNTHYVSIVHDDAKRAEIMPAGVGILMVSSDKNHYYPLTSVMSYTINGKQEDKNNENKG